MLVRLLGFMVVLSDGGDQVDCGGMKQRAVLAQLALEPNRAVSIDRLAEGVWGAQIPPRYRQGVQVYVSTLRRALEPTRLRGTPSRIVGHGESYELVASEQETDVSSFRLNRKLGDAALESGQPQTAVDHLRAALSGWRGEPLADLLACPFAADAVRILREEELLARESLLAAQLASGEHRALLGDLHRLVSAHPDRENLWEHLVVAQVRSGRQVEALASVRRARQILLTEYGLDPSPRMRTLERQVLNQDPELLGATPPRVRVAQVPVPLAPAIGRTEVVSDIVNLLRRGSRLTVLIGPGGVGKTRLSLEVMNHSGELQVGRRVWVSFTDETAQVSIAGVLATHLGTPVDDLEIALRREPHLVCFDNLEHIVDAGRQVALLLSRVADLTLLVTSRGPLGVAEERSVAVAPLQLDDAVALFAERARAVQPDFDTSRWASPVNELCSRLDCLPLAIELAAARVAVLDPADLLEAIASVAALKAGSGESGRHASMRATVQWSVDLLSPGQRVGLSALAVLDGPVGIGVAQAVLDAVSPASRLEGQERTEVERLVEVALVQPLETPSGRRFGMLSTIRAVAVELADPPNSAVRGIALRAIAKYWISRRDSAKMTAEWKPRELAAVGLDLPVMRQVVHELSALGRVNEAADLVISRRRAFSLLGRQDAMFTLLSEVLDHDLDRSWRTRAQVIAGSAAYALHRPEAQELLGHVDDLDPLDDTFRVFGHCYRAVLSADTGSPDAASRDLDVAVVHAQRSGDVALLATVHSAATWVATEQHDHRTAMAHAQEGARAALTIGDEPSIVLAMIDLARAELSGDSASAERALSVAQEAFQRARRSDLGLQMAESQQFIGYAMIRLGRSVDGARVLVEALKTISLTADQGWVLDLVATIAAATLDSAEHAAASRLLLHARALAATFADRPPLPDLIRPAFPDLQLDPSDPLPVVVPDIQTLVDDARRIVDSVLPESDTAEVD